jgi:HAD superfamily hydrolase (TIGR01484 family)
MTSKIDILLCCDLDRTLLPNGDQDEWPGARPTLRRVAGRSEIQLVYVSGRDMRLMQDAIADYDLPSPNQAVGDVGTTMYRINGGDWVPQESWHAEIGQDWHGLSGGDLAGYLKEFKGLTPQEPEKQNRFKLSYYTEPTVDDRQLTDQIQQHLSSKGLRSRVIWSVDEQRDVGLLDVLPERASKLHAIRYLMDRDGYSKRRVVFCGDSGNDLNVLTSDLQAVLVKNASEKVRREAREIVVAKGRPETLYLAEGNFLGMNGNYAAGVLEGLAHFIPAARAWIEEAVAGLNRSQRTALKR